PESSAGFTALPADELARDFAAFGGDLRGFAAFVDLADVLLAIPFTPKTAMTLTRDFCPRKLAEEGVLIPAVFAEARLRHDAVIHDAVMMSLLLERIASSSPSPRRRSGSRYVEAQPPRARICAAKP
ncbi:MAG: hypothetical protein Q8O23_01460, partial [Gallionella sp.]|nr:hypothetical protein [Gallionella sp.]